MNRAGYTMSLILFIDRVLAGRALFIAPLQPARGILFIDRVLAGRALFIAPLQPVRGILLIDRILEGRWLPYDCG